MPSTDSATDSRITPLAWLFLALSALWCIVWLIHGWHYWEDDAFIHLEFARSVSRGQGFSFNGHVVNGDTSPLWVYLLVAFHRIIPDWIAGGKVLNVLGVVFAGAGAFFFSRKLTANTVFSAAMVGIFVLGPYFNYWAFSGMETITAAGLAFWAATIVSDRLITWPRFLAACLIAGIGPILRPEMAFLSVVLAVVLLQRWTAIPARPAAKLAGFLAGLLLACAPTVAWGYYALHVFGRVVPNTNAAKRAGPHQSVVSRLVQLYALGYPIILVAVLAGLLYLAYRLLRKDRKEATPLSASLGTLPTAGWIYIVWSAIATVFYLANHTWVQTRYIFVTASGLTITVLAIVFLAAPRWTRLVTAATALVALGVSAVVTWPFVGNKGVADDSRKELSLWIKHNIPPNDPVAVYSIGEIAYFSEHPIIDIGGITRPGVIPYLNLSADSVEQWARSEGAKYYIAGDKPEPGAVIVHTSEEPDYGWHLNPQHFQGRTTVILWKLP